MATISTLFGSDAVQAQSELAWESKGLLLSRSEGSEFRLVSLSDKTVPMSRFELPASR